MMSGWRWKGYSALKKLKKDTKRLRKEIKTIRENIPETLRKFEETEVDSGHYYVQVVAYLKEMSNSLSHIVQPAFNHLDNNHSLDKEQADVLKTFNEKISEFFNYIINILRNRNFEKMDDLNHRRNELIDMANNILRNRIKILKKTQKGTKVSMTYIEMLTESKNLLLNLVQLVKADTEMAESINK